MTFCCTVLTLRKEWYIMRTPRDFLLYQGYEECLTFEDKLKCIINSELSSQDES